MASIKDALSDSEYALYEEWIMDHRCNGEDIRPTWVELNNNSGIGTRVVVFCECGQCQDITNYSLW